MDAEELLKSTKPKTTKPQKRRHVQTEARKVQQAQFLKRGNPGGRPKQHTELVAQIRENADAILGILLGFLSKPELTYTDKIRWMICESLLDRAFGQAARTTIAAIQHTSLDGTTLALEGASMSPLLAQAHAYAAAEATQPRSKAIDVIAEPATPSTPPSAQPFIADPAGNGAMYVEAGSVAKIDAKPAPPPERPTETAQEPVQTGRPFPGATGRDERDEAERVARLVQQARAEGRGQIGPEEAFPPDPREPAEVVNFTLAGKGRIRRC